MKLRSLWNWPPVAVMIPLLLVCPAVARVPVVLLRKGFARPLVQSNPA